MEHIDNATLRQPVTQPRRLLSGLARWLAQVGEAMEQASARRELAELDDRMLADIGVSRGEAMQEAGRSFFDCAPPPVDASRVRVFQCRTISQEAGSTRPMWTSPPRVGRPSA